MGPLIEFKAVTKSFRHARRMPTVALNRLTFSVEPGSIYALLGRNGAGKSTALRMITGLIAPDSGEVLVMGESPEAWDDLMKSRVGYAGSERLFFPDMTVSEACDYVRKASPGWDGKLCREILREGGIPRDKRVGVLSQGQEQRLRLALAYAKRPTVLVLDEPTLGLDTVVRFQLFSRVLDVVAGGDACAVISSHVLGDVERIVDRVGFISKGKIILEGPLDDFKEGARRVRVAWPEGWDPGDALERTAGGAGAPAFHRSGRQASFVTARCSEAWLASVRRDFPQCRIDADPLSLEDIFIELLGEEES